MEEQRQPTRLARNSVILYFRMIVITVISLYSSRLILQLLGLNDFGIFSVVAGIIEFAAIFTGTMTSATQRFLAFDLGKGDMQTFNRTFCSLYNIFIIFCLLLLVVAIPIGLWLVNSMLDIPADRLYAATWVLVCAILSFELQTLATPYLSAVIAYERMGAYTWFTVAEAVLKLAVLPILFLYHGDRLIAYSLSIVLIRLALNIAIALYARQRLEGCRFHPSWDSRGLRQLTAYAGWSLIGATSHAMMTQGHSILLNIFFGPVINAAKGIADRVKNYSLMFSSNIFLAIAPQITKNYATGNIAYMHDIVYTSTRISFLLMLVVAFPLVMEMQPLLELWLGAESVTAETTSFCIYSLVVVLIACFEAPLTKVVQATGNIRSYEIIVGIATLLFIPVSYVLLKMGYDANATFLTMNIIYFAVLFYRFHRVHQLVALSPRAYLRRVVLPVILVMAILATAAWAALATVTPHLPFAARLALWLLLACAVVWFFGITAQEKSFCKTQLRKITKH